MNYSSSIGKNMVWIEERHAHAMGVAARKLVQNIQIGLAPGHSVMTIDWAWSRRTY